MKRDGVDILVSMLTPPEVVELGLAEEARLSPQAGIEFRSIAIPGRETPESYAPITAFLADLRTELHRGKSLAVHCRASIGRSSLLLACLLCAEGMSADEAFVKITEARGAQVPDTPQQVRWVEKFAASLSVPKR
jgi:protein-tyrosine phosphatase